MDEDGDALMGGTALAAGARGGLSPEASRLFRVYKTVAAMLTKRGYLVSREMKEMTPASFTAKFGEYPTREGLTILTVRTSTSNLVLSRFCRLYQ
jgi:DNA-directed RNA polymerase I, II, and III subunit RPABC1